MTHSIDPTTLTYSVLKEAYAFFNARLFSGRLPSCLITMQRRNRTYGYFAGRRFTTRDGVEVTDEIALNPSRFAECSTEETLATLVREMVHLEQEHFGTPSRPGYHNRKWAERMGAVGLIPTATGEPGGKQTGQRVGHSSSRADPSRWPVPSWLRTAVSRCPTSNCGTRPSAKRGTRGRRVRPSTPVRDVE